MAEIEGSHAAAWWAITGCSAVVLGAFEADHEGSRDTQEKWILAGTIITMSIGFLAVLATRAASDKFVGQRAEHGTSALCLGLWCGLLPVIMDPSNGIAQGSVTGADFQSSRGVTNANIYFFSWGAFISCLFVVAKINQEATGVSRFSETPKKMTHWYMVLAAGVALMWAATKFWKDLDDELPFGCDDANGDNEETCRRTSYAIFVGAIAALIGMCAVVLSKCGFWPWFVELFCSFLLMGFYAVGVGIITFKTGPGVQINNIYFATWLGLLFNAWLTMDTFAEFRNRAEEEGEAEDKGEDVKDKGEEEAAEGEAEKGEAQEEDAPADEGVSA